MAREKMEAAGSLAFEISIDLDIVQDGRTRNIQVTYVGDVRQGWYRSYHVTVAAPDGTVESHVIGDGPNVNVLEESIDGWRVDGVESPYFLDLSAFFRVYDGSVPSDFELTGRKLVDGIEMDRVEGKLPRFGIVGAMGDLDVAYWIGTEDGLVREVSATGQLDVTDNTTLIGSMIAEQASVKLTGKLFDHGKHVALVVPDLSVPRFGHDAVLLDDGRVLVGGGFTGIANNNVIVPFPIGLVQLYESEKGFWTLLEPLDGPGFHYSSIKLFDGRVLFVGLGYSEDKDTGMASIFDPVSSSWVQLPGSSSPRSFPSLALLDDGRVLVAGGRDFSADARADAFPYSLPEVANVVEILDANTGDWQSATSMIRALPEQWLFALNDGRVMALGVLSDDSSYPTAHAEIYNPTTDMWTPVTIMEPKFVPADAVKLDDDRLLVVGVSSGTGWQLPEARIYDPATDTWTPGGEMTHRRPDTTLVLLPDGRVLAAGGEDSWGEGFLPYSTTEILDPSSLSWSAGPHLSELRAGSSATLLRDGMLLLSGGIGMVLDIEEVYPLGSSELVDPDSPGSGAPLVTSR